MRLPFEKTKTFTTSLSKGQVIGFVRERLNRKSKGLFITKSEYVGSIEGMTFRFYKNYNAKNERSNAIIKGSVLTENPTTVEITISPHYLWVLFFMIFPCLFIPAAIFNDYLEINGALVEPNLIERICFGLIGGVGPMIWCYFDYIKPIKEAELWITEKLKLKEISPLQL